MTFERARWREFTQLVAYHVFRYVYRHVFATVVYCERVAHELRENRRTTRPSFNDDFLIGTGQLINFLDQVAIHERSFFQTATHGMLLPSRRVFTLIISRSFTPL